MTESSLFDFTVGDAFNLIYKIREDLNELRVEEKVYVPPTDPHNQETVARELDIDYLELSATVSKLIPVLIGRMEDQIAVTEDELQTILEYVGGAGIVSFLAGVMYQQRQIEIVEPTGSQ